MSKEDKLIIKALGLNTQPNEFGQPSGSLSVCENMDITRDNIAQVSVGFKDQSSNIPKNFTPDQLISIGGTIYLHTDKGIWYFDGTNWMRKQGSFGNSFTSPYAIVSSSSSYSDSVAFMSSSDGVIYKLIIGTGTRKIICGLSGTFSGTDGTGTAARFSNSIKGLSIKPSNDMLYVSDTGNHTIRSVTISSPTASISSTVAGTAGASGSTNATGSLARFNGPTGICSDNTNIYVCDTGNHTIRKIVISSGAVTTFAGTAGASGSADATGASARFNGPKGICIDPGSNSLYVSDTGNHTIRKIDIATAAVTTIIGTAGASGDTPGFSSSARLNGPEGLCFLSSWPSQSSRPIFLADTQNNKIKIIIEPALNGIYACTDYAGSGSAAFQDGILTNSSFNKPSAVCDRGSFTGDPNLSNLLVCDTENNCIRLIYANNGTAYTYTIDGRLDGFDSPAGATGIPYVNGVLDGPP